MPTYKKFELGEVARVQTGFGLIGPDSRGFRLLGGAHKDPLLLIVFPTEAEAQAAHDAIAAAFAKAIAVVTPGD